MGADGPKCRSCGEPLLFVENVKTGARLPLVRKPNRARVEQLKPGMIVVSPSGRFGSVLTLDDLGDAGRRDGLVKACDEERVHATHFGNCPQARSWQGKRPAART